MQRTIGINNAKSRMKPNVEDNMTRLAAPYLFRSSTFHANELAQTNKQWKSHDDIPNMWDSFLIT